MFILGEIIGWEFLLVLAVIALLFGSSKLPKSPVDGSGEIGAREGHARRRRQERRRRPQGRPCRVLTASNSAPEPEHGRITGRCHSSDESGHERHANRNEDETAERLAPAFGEPAESVAEFEPDQRKKHADGPDDDRGEHDGDRRSAKPETGYKVVDPQNEAGNDQLSETEIRPQRFATCGSSRRLPQRVVPTATRNSPPIG